jgi:hypothetical protein
METPAVKWSRLALLLLCLLVPSSVRATGTLAIPNNLAAQSGPNVNASLLDANWVAIRDYVNARELTVDVAANRPAAGTSGRYYFATNTNGGTLYFDTGSTWQQIAPALVSTLAEQLTGLTLSNDGTNPSTTVDIAVGAASSDDAAIANRVLISLTSAITKTTAAWAVGTGNGALDSGAIAASTWYHWYIITRTDTGVVDALLSTSASAPTMPANYTKKRRIGSALTDASKAINFFTQDGDYFVLSTQVMTNSSNPGTAASNVVLNVPTGVTVQAIGEVLLRNGGTASTIYVSDPASADQAPITVAAALTAPGFMLANNNAGTAIAGTLILRTNTSGQWRYRLSASDANVAVGFGTIGWLDRRGSR